MPEENTALYSRGKYRLEWDRRRDGSLRTPFLQIVWYDDAAGRNRSRSAGTGEMRRAEEALDRLYLERERGQAVCPTCGKPMDQAAGHLVTQAIGDYLVAREEVVSIDAIKPRLAHFIGFMGATDRLALTCDQVDEGLIETFRRWSAKQPVIEGAIAQKERARAPGTTEASVRSLAAAINYAHNRRETPFKAAFTALPPATVSRTPTFRADVAQLAAMFRYCTDPRPQNGEVWSDKMRTRQKLHRQNLLRFLQISVATWCRPDAAHDVSTKPERDQWIPNARVVQLNPRGRRQTKKYRPAVPVPERFARLLDATDGFFVTVDSVRKAFEAMLDELSLPRDRETGLKLIRRSVAQIARKQIGEERWRQGEIMLGHAKVSTSDLYALFDPANLGVALGATTALIAEIETLTPGAFSPLHTGLAPEQIRVVPQRGNLNACE